MLIRFVSVLIFILSLSACQHIVDMAHLPLLNEPLTFQITDQDERNSMLIVEPYADGQWRFVQVDSLGAPVSRQILHQGKWRNDGFLPPNAKAQKLFTAVSVLISKQKNWPLAAGSEQIRIENTAESGTYQLYWHKQQWTIREITND